MHCVALILVIPLNRFVLHKFDLSSFLFLLGIIHAVAGLGQELTGMGDSIHWTNQKVDVG